MPTRFTKFSAYDNNVIDLIESLTNLYVEAFQKPVAEADEFAQDLKSWFYHAGVLVYQFAFEKSQDEYKIGVHTVFARPLPAPIRMREASLYAGIMLKQALEVKLQAFFPAHKDIFNYCFDAYLNKLNTHDEFFAVQAVVYGKLYSFMNSHQLFAPSVAARELLLAAYQQERDAAVMAGKTELAQALDEQMTQCQEWTAYMHPVMPSAASSSVASLSIFAPGVKSTDSKSSKPAHRSMRMHLG